MDDLTKEVNVPVELSEVERAKKNKKAVKGKGPARKKKSRNYSVKEIGTWKFKTSYLPEDWHGHLGNIPDSFTMLVKGKPKNGKTEYLMKLTKMFAQTGKKVNYNSPEQGKSQSMKEAFIRNKMDEIKGGKWMLADASQRKFEPWFERLQRPNSGKVIVLDSLNYMNLTTENYKKLTERFKNRIIIIVAWLPLNTSAKELEYMVDMVVEVSNYVAKSFSRYGGNKPYKVWPNRKKDTALDFEEEPEVNPAPSPESIKDAVSDVMLSAIRNATLEKI